VPLKKTLNLLLHPSLYFSSGTFVVVEGVLSMVDLSAMLLMQCSGWLIRAML
jgi:hypothetical protein